MKLTVVLPILNNFKMTNTCIEMLNQNARLPETKILVLDNGSDKEYFNDCNRVLVQRLPYCIGNYPIFDLVRKIPLDSEIIAVLHNDLFVWEEGWDQKIVETFEQNQKLGLLGVIGSNEFDRWGGRGLGTASNFQGKTAVSSDSDPSGWTGSPAEPHGKRITSYMPAVVIDGCAMIFRKDALEKIENRPEMAPHHFYDKLMSCQVLEAGYQVGVLGLAVDHCSGQTANTQETYFNTVRNWAFEKWGMEKPEEWINLPGRREWYARTDNPPRASLPSNWDMVAYLESEYQFLTEYRDQKHLIPCKV